MKQANDPFIGPRGYGATDAVSRIEMVARFDAAQCQAALAVPGLQKTVERKIHTRLRQLERQARQ